MPDWIILADDLTGACDTGAGFAAQGARTRVVLTPDASLGSAQVGVLTSESRALPEAAAVQAVERAVQRLNEQGVSFPVSYFYKKIDSTLRGHPGAEWQAVLAALKPQTALVVPAFPAQGRTVRGGQVYVHGLPLAETVISRDVAQPNLLAVFDAGSGCDLLSIADVRQGAAHLADYFMRRPRAVFVSDAETEADLDCLAEASLQVGIRLFCGSAGLARALARRAGFNTPASEFIPHPGPVLVGAGSHSPATFIQLTALARQGFGMIDLSLEKLRVANKVTELVEQLERGISIAVHVSGMEFMPGQEQQVAEALVALTSAALARVRVCGLILTGGDTASAVCRALHCQAIDLGGEVQPGLVWGALADGPFAGLPVVTKAGGFGGEDALLEAVQFLKPSS